MDSQDRERLECITAFWVTHKKRIATVAMVAVILIGVATFWQNKQLTIKQQSSETYHHMIVSFQSKELATTTALAQHLMSDYAQTPYAGMAALLLSKMALDEGQVEEAVAHLQWVCEKTNDAWLQDTAYARLARLALWQEDSDAAENWLSHIKTDHFDSLKYELEGDRYVQLGQLEQAAEAYRQAIDKDQAAMESRAQLVEMKKNNLPL